MGLDAGCGRARGRRTTSGRSSIWSSRTCPVREQPFYCVGAQATHYFPLSIPYHGCALNITVQSYLDTLDFGLVACSETVPDAQRIADFMVEDFAALKRADAELPQSEMVQKIAAALSAKPPETAKPIRLGEAKPPPPPVAPETTSALSRQIDALAQATEVLRRRLDRQDTDEAATRAPERKPAAKRSGAPKAAKSAVVEAKPPRRSKATPSPARKAPAGKTGRTRRPGVTPKP